MNDVLVAGLGNPLMRDEGIGPRVVELLRERAGDDPRVDFEDLGTPGLGLLHALRGRRRVVIVDCAMMGEPPGTWRRFLPDDVRSAGAGAVSAHQPDLLGVLRLARQIGGGPSEVIVFGIQPAAVEPGIGLSETLEARLDDYVRAVRAELATQE